MPYADYIYYKSEFKSDRIPSSLFDKYILQASYEIEKLTLGRARADIDQVKKATCAIADILYQEEHDDKMIKETAYSYLLTTGLMYCGDV